MDKRYLRGSARTPGQKYAQRRRTEAAAAARRRKASGSDEIATMFAFAVLGLILIGVHQVYSIAINSDPAKAVIQLVEKN